MHVCAGLNARFGQSAGRQLLEPTGAICVLLITEVGTQQSTELGTERGAITTGTDLRSPSESDFCFGKIHQHVPATSRVLSELRSHDRLFPLLRECDDTAGAGCDLIYAFHCGQKAQLT